MSDPQVDPAQESWKYEQNRAMAERNHDMVTDYGNRVNGAVAETSHNTLRALIIINGGAAITVLAFIGQIVSSDKLKVSATLADVTTPIIWFAIGVALAVVGSGAAYFTNYSLAVRTSAMTHHYDRPYIRPTKKSKYWQIGAIVFQIIAVLAASASLGFFVYGMFEVQKAVWLLH